MEKIINSNIAIDLGGKYTGVVSYTAEGTPTSEDINALIIRMPEQGSGISYTVKDRTSVRHHIRAEDRFKKARRLIFSVLSYVIKRELTSAEREAVSSLMKRRGYTRLEAEIEFEAISNASVEFFSSCIDVINEDSPLLEQFTKITSSVESTRQFSAKLNSIKWDDKYKSIQDTNERTICKNAVDEMKDACNAILSQELFGHKHRKQYLEAIKHDLQKDSRLTILIEQLGGFEKLYKCVGNISNLQLRALRWYFNDVSMKGNAEFKPDRFKSVWKRAYQFFHYPSDDVAKVKELLSEIESSKDIINTLCSLDPVRTIPPYEDQNNRKPPIDQTLLLSSKALDERYKEKWEEWTEILSKEIPVVKENLDVIVSQIDRQSRRKNLNSESYTLDKLKHSYTLHRIFDLSKNDKLICNIREWSKAPNNKKNFEVNSYLESLLGEDVDSFLKLCSDYYKECDYAKRGLWSIIDNPLLELSSIHPPMKKRPGVMSDIVGGILGIHSRFDFDFFKSNIWKAKIKGNSSVCSLCKAIEETRKSYGNSFKTEYEYVTRKKNNSENKLSKEEKLIDKIITNVKVVSKFIADNLGLDELDKLPFENPFSLAQLYTVLETDIHGFSSNCISVVNENSWRMQSFGKSGAICSRLVAESVRPFDGSLGKILDRQAYEIAKRKVNELKSLPSVKNAKINLGIVIESNKFEFTSSIAQIKKSVKRKKLEHLANKGIERENQRFKSKKERIIRDSHNICAYTGMALDGIPCEVDHIISRSFTKASMGTVFNSEVNLIYVSQKGNQDKKEQQYTLQQLHKNYLLAVFNTSDLSQIKQIITDTVENVLISNPNFIFDSMSEIEIQSVRHALFMPGTEVYFKVLAVLAKQYSTRVNGTQAWFVREIIFKIKGMLQDWLKLNNNELCFESWKINSIDTHELREELSTKIPEIKKREKQPITSHAIDALCVLANASTDQRKSEFLGNNGSIDFLSTSEIFSQALPSQYEICDVSKKPFADKDEPQSRQLFKDTIYAEHFLPIMVLGDTIKIGFDWKNNNFEVIKGKDRLIELLSPLFTEKYEENTKFHTYHIDKSLAFDLMHRATVSKLDKTENDTLKCLLKLYYSTKKEDVKVIYDSKKKQFKSRNDVLSLKQFSIKVDTTITSQIELKSNEEGYLTLPSISSWDVLISKFDSKKDEKGEEHLYEFCNQIKRIGVQHKMQHRKIKQKHSLPMLDSPSGGYRLKRLDYNNNQLYQLVAVNTPVTVESKGISCVNGSIDWKKTVPLDIYQGQKITKLSSLNSIEESEEYKANEDYISMNREFILCKNKDISVSIQLATNSRPYIYIEQKFKDFNKCLNNRFMSYLDLDASIIIEKTDLDAFMSCINSSIHMSNSELTLPSPRNDKKKPAKLYFLIVGDEIKFYYEASGNNKSMKNVIQELVGGK